MRQAKYPAGWDAERVRRVLEHYEAQSEEEAIAEDEAAYEATTHTAMDVPVELVPAVRELIAKRGSKRRPTVTHNLAVQRTGRSRRSRPGR